MKVILFYIGDYPVRSYGVVVALAIILAIGVAYYLVKGTKYRRHVLDMSIYVIIGAIIGARFWHVFFFQWGYYSQNLNQIFSIWNGGLAIQGGLVGGFIAGALYTWYHKLDFFEIADLLAPAIIFGQGVGRIACLLNGDAFGSPTGSNFGLVYPPGTIAYERYGSQPLWPAEVWEGQWDLIVFGLLLILKNRTWPKGFIFLAYNILYSFGRFMLEFLRGDSPRYLFEWTAAQWTSVTVIILSIIFMIVFTLKAKREVHADTK
ncbi:prolipoprotein diacylglyceryl transferase [Parageobacillus thermoglucosidasius]|jgi:phosphatidylglycerol:prolipoprotein diacylglycerol transferase|uniref:prolipoprotein diacylglyceryl transferase n=1 Tax=Parageobacillus thermoglucosidasius TaxID=1426 RepID=UPI000B55CD80|nr:prolipoprotein diacylglyceryl transferase [Parageobacillus thermoglucosidasius]OUM90467.1 MAG: prolipoprotein diacylglyceryl transferase [Parageobacillus thermoglucosidasius]